jgi:lipid-A-disaccharide synthase
MKIYFIAGEASGDLHAANLMAAMNRQQKGYQFRGLGGDKMQAHGLSLFKHIRDLSYMGFWEVIKNLPVILRNIRETKKDIERFAPEGIVLVDFPGFNFRIAEFAHAKGIKVVYYISPQLWAWKEGRVKRIKKWVDRLYVILPFETEFYQKHGVKALFMGHPLLDALEQSRDQSTSFETFTRDNLLSDQPIIALLPGSRRQEIGSMLSVMSTIRKNFPQHQLVVAGMNNYAMDYYRSFCQDPSIAVVYDQTYALLRHAKAAVVTSGTATLETALIGTPLVVVYQAGKISYSIAKRLIKIPYISLVNLIPNKLVVKELIQHDFNTENLTKEVDKLLNDTAYRSLMKENFANIRQLLGGAGASEKIAADFSDWMQSIHAKKSS